MRIPTSIIAVLLLLAFFWLYSLFGIPVILIGIIAALILGFFGADLLKTEKAEKGKWK